MTALPSNFAIVDTQYGKVLVAQQETELVSFLFLQENESRMTNLFYSKFPNSKNCASDSFTHIANAVLSGKHVQYKLYGTHFQKSVWNELLQINDTISYKQLSHRIKKPKAVRAVANAVANNLLHVVIPCHLVVKINGETGNYAGGTELKKKLISHFPLNKSF